ncbi:MAG: ArsR family transcriptional regulator [Candidatus Bathyarchaeota archaeon]|nr:MAG: ArsR family transcriptional regulator [Candidatus Bathyarchaeota archaeon]
MSDEPKSKTVTKSIDETRQYHIQYLRAVNSPLRRSILRALGADWMSLKDLQVATKLSFEVLEWHLQMLENGFCIEKKTEKGTSMYRVTQEGRIVDYLEL